jgi:hypothetical protein
MRMDSAGDVSAPNGPFGTGYFYTWLGAADFRPESEAMGHGFNIGDFHFYADTGVGGTFVAPLNLPSGALLQTARLFYYDNDASAGLSLGLCRVRSEGIFPPTPTVACPFSVSNTQSETPGYATMSFDPDLTFLVRDDDDLDGTMEDTTWYFLLQFTGNKSSLNRVRGVRLYWKLQISPAPTTASFTDVPVGSQSFQAVEALKASGITAGCTTTTYCPNQAVTRAQMALFLSRALGLSWNY